MPGPERKVQWEFKVIVQVPETAWPHEVSDDIRCGIQYNTDVHGTGYTVASVEQILDYT